MTAEPDLMGGTKPVTRRLDAAALGELAQCGMGLPYERTALQPGIVHIGIGAFHRAHMAHYIHRLLATEPGWAIVGASLRRPDTRDALEPQNYLYSLSTSDDTSIRTEIIGSVIDIIDASVGSEALLRQLAQPSIRIVSLTVTEKGYCHEPGSGALQLTHPDIMHDLANGRTPRSVPGILVAALAERRARGLGGFTVLSCDNLQGNGRIIRRAVLDFARLHDAALAEWIDHNASFPGTMVDRIVPSTTDQDRAEVAQKLSYQDAWPVMSEPFTQWVVEDDFVNGRPALETVGVQMVDDVEPFERMKLRMLNGAHSAIAYLGLLQNKTFVAEVVADPVARQFLRRQMLTEAAPTLPLPAAEMERYADRLLERFANPELKHRCAQIAMDGSQKLPQRILAPVRERLSRDEQVPLMALTLAAWIGWIERCATDPDSVLVDPMAETLLVVLSSAGNSSFNRVQAILSIEAIAGKDLVQSASLVAAIASHLDRLAEGGPLSAMEAAINL